MKILKVIMAAATAVAVGGAANAATLSFTEGNRDVIVGSTQVTMDGTGVGDTAGSPPGFDLGSIGSGDTIDVYGRIINLDDFYQFTSSFAFSISWIFDGYTTVGVSPNGQSAAAGESGFVSTPLENAGDGSATFTLTNLLTDTVVGTASFTTNVVSGSAENLFGGGFEAGSYGLKIDGTGPLDALYDIQIAAVPLPAGGLLLLTALGGLGFARRRRSA